MGPCRFHKAAPPRAPYTPTTHANIFATNPLNIKTARTNKNVQHPDTTGTKSSPLPKTTPTKIVATNMHATKNDRSTQPKTLTPCHTK